MDFDRYTNKSKKIIQDAQSEAVVSGHQKLTVAHLLKVLIEEEDLIVKRLLEQSGASFSAVQNLLQEELTKIPVVQGSGAGQIYLEAETAKVLKNAEEIAKQKGDKFVTLERMLQAIVNEQNSVASGLKKLGVDKQKLDLLIDELRQGRTADSENAEESFEALEKYCVDLTKAVSEGKLDPVIGRDEEVRRIIQVLCRRTKNNPILIGEPGVGKTAMIEGLAQRIAAGDVPENLKNQKVLVLDLGALIAGAKYRGEFEERLKAVLNEIKSSKTGIVLFIDEIHTLVGAGATQGAMDASNLLKPALARGELHCVGATTLDEYTKYVEKDAALARRFQQVFVAEPTVEDTISILRGLKEKYEMHHGIRIADSAIIAAAMLSDRYISDRFLPDKAIDLVDEASSRLRMQVDSKPEEIDVLDRKIMQLKIEQLALQKEKDASSKERLSALENELSELEKQSLELTTKWQSQKNKLNEVKELKEKLDAMKLDLELAQRSGDFEKAGKLTYGMIPEITKKIEGAEQTKSQVMLQEEVSEKDIAYVVSKWTGVPVAKMLQGEKEKLLDMENLLRKNVVGQEYALKAVSQAIRRSRAGVSDPDKPIGSFLFLGPTGVGKTELTKSLANFLFDDPNAMVRLDMSEYMEKHSVARLIGAPPGYVGYEQGGVLTEAVRRRPYQVILFDEIEKAHPDIFNALLQVLDDGRLTDGQGRVVNFKNTVIILTSNLGSKYIMELADSDDLKKIEGKVFDVVRDHFRPEFINRLDEMIIFNKLQKDNMQAIVEIQLDKLNNLLADKKIQIELTAKAKDYLAEKGYDPAFGARPIKRVMQTEINNRISEMLLQGEMTEQQKVKVDAKKGELVFEISS